MPISVTNRQLTAKIDRRWIAKQARKLLRLLNCPDDELSVLFVDDDEMAELNGRYRGEEIPTDVLAFPMREGLFVSLQPGLLGDVVISVETARRQIRPGGSSGRGTRSDAGPLEVTGGDPLGKEVIRLLTHGALHLLGYDHQNPAGTRKMRAQERWCLQELWEKE
jgi:probable rRNA maturation factor